MKIYWPWYECLTFQDFENVVIEEIRKAWNWTKEKAENYYYNDLEKRSCFDYGVSGIGVHKDGSEYSSTRLAILRILHTQGIRISDEI